jgi:hypothetical protein
MVISMGLLECESHRIHRAISCRSMTRSRTRCTGISRLFPGGFPCFYEESKGAYLLLIKKVIKAWKENTLPTPAVDFTPISPPCSSVSSREMNKPRPDPPY